MKINNLNRITFWVLATGLLVSCNDNDFLREKTESSYTYVNAFNVSSQVNDCVTDLYHRHKQILIPNSNDRWFMVGQGTDICDFGKSTNGEGAAVSVFSNWSTTYGKTETIYNEFYSLIARANLVVHGAEQVSWAEL